jgi:hypothetical protein
VVTMMCKVRVVVCSGNVVTMSNVSVVCSGNVVTMMCRVLVVVVCSGNVVTMECVEKLIKKDMIDPTNGAPLTDKDILVLQRVRSHT